MPILEVILDANGAIVGARQADGAFKSVSSSARKNLGDMETYGKRVEGSFDRLKQSIFSVKGALISLGAGALLTKTMSEFEQFEMKLSDMGKVTERSFALMRQEIMALPKDLGSASQLMSGYYNVISAGVEGTANQLDTLVAASKAAKSAHIEQGSAIAGLTSLVDAYEGKIKDATEAADLLFTIEKQGKTTVAELIPYVGQLASTSASLGISQNELGAAFAQVTKFAGGTSFAATQYQSLLTSLMKPTTEMAKLLNKMGGAEKAIQDIGFEGTLRKIQEATGGSATALSKFLGNKESLLGFLSLAKQDFAGLTKNVDAFGESAGAMDKAWNDYKQTMTSVKETFYATIGAFAIDFATELAPDIKEGLEDFSGWMNDNKAEIVSGFKDIGSAVSGVASAIGTIGVAITSLPQSSTGALGTGLIVRYLFGKVPLGRVASNFLLIAGAIDTIGTAVNKVTGVNAMPTIGWFNQILINYANAFEKAGMEVTGFFRALKAALNSDTLADLPERVVNAFNDINPAVKMTKEELAAIEVMELDGVVDPLVALADSELHERVVIPLQDLVVTASALSGDSGGSMLDVWVRAGKAMEDISALEFGAYMQDVTDKTSELTSKQKSHAEMVERLNRDYKTNIAYLNQLGTKDWEFEVKIDFVAPEDDLFGGYDDPQMAEAIDRMTESADYFKGVMDGLNESLTNQSDLFENSIFGDAASQNIQNLAVTMGKLVDMYDEIAKAEKDLAKERKNISYIADIDLREEAFEALKIKEQKLSEQSLSAQLSGYREFFSVSKSMFEENSAAYHAFALAEQTASMAQILISGVQAIINAMASGDPYTAIARGAAMAVAVAAVASQVGVSIRGVSGGGSTDSYSGGTYMSDTSGDWKTESMSDVYDMLEEYDAKQYVALLDIYYEVRALNKNITGLITGLLKGMGQFEIVGDFEFSESPAKSFLEKMNDALFGWLPLWDSMIGQILSGFITTFLGDVGSYLFGGEVRTDLLTIGITLREWVSLADLMKGGAEGMFEWFAYIDKVTEGGAFSDDSHERKTLYETMDKEVADKLISVFGGIVESMVSVAELFGFTEDQISTLLDQDFWVGNIQDLEKMNGDELADAFNKWFASFADELAEDWFGDIISRYQQIDEGMYETAIRVAAEMIMIQEAVSMTGNIVEASAEDWIHLSQALIDAAGSVDELMDSVSVYFEEFMTDAEKQAYVYEMLAGAFANLGMAMPETRDAFKDLVSSIDFTTVESLQLYVQLMDLADATDAYYDALEAANQSIIDAKRKLLGTEGEGALSDIESRYGWAVDENNYTDFINKFLSMTEEDIRSYAEAVGVSVEDLTDDIMWLADYFGWLEDAAENAGTSITALAEDIRQNLATMRADLYGTGGGASAIYSSIIGKKDEVAGALSTGDMDTAMGILQIMSQDLGTWYQQALSERKAEETERLNSQRDILNEQLSVAQAFGGLLDTIESTIQSIKYSSLSVSIPTEKATMAEEEYTTLRDAAMATGSVDDYQKFVSFAQTALEQYQARYKSSGTYQEFYDEVMGDLEAAAANAEAKSYDEAILAQLESIANELENIDISGVVADFESVATYIEGMLAQLEKTDILLSIDWANYDGTMADALADLKWLGETYGWDHVYTLEFISEIPMDLFGDLNDLAYAAGFIADTSGGWNSTATVKFLKNVGANWEFESVNDILHAIGYVKAQAGSWTADATISFIAGLFDHYTGDALDNIEGWLDKMGISDQTIRSEMEIKLVYKLWSDGDVDTQGMADWAYAKLLGSGVASVSKAYSMVDEVVNLMSMIGDLENYANVGSLLYQWSPLAQAAFANEADLQSGVYNAFKHAGYPHFFADGGLVTSPTLGWVGEAGYPELVIPMKDGNVPVKMINGGSTQAGANRGEEIRLLKEQNRLLAEIIVQNGQPLKVEGMNRHQRAVSEDVLIRRIGRKKMDSMERYEG